MGYSGAQGKLIHEINLKLKISFQTPFKMTYIEFFAQPVILFAIFANCTQPAVRRRRVDRLFSQA
jgi:hypothetical protein